MKLVTAHAGRLHIDADDCAPAERVFGSGLAAIDRLMPNAGFRYGTLHELLAEDANPLPMFFAALLARQAMETKAIVWLDPLGQLYPPALAAMGIDLDRLWIVRPRDDDLLWALAESLRCTGAAAVVAPIASLRPLEARRLQLAAEAGGAAAILLRRPRLAQQHAAASRWLVSPLPGSVLLQRWHLQLVHGHGGHPGQCVILEACRETDTVRAFVQSVDRSHLAERA